MGSMTRRLHALEERERELATAEIRRAWDRLSDEEIVLIAGPLLQEREPTEEESAAEDRARAMMPEQLIARALGYSEALSPEEVSRRIGELLAPVIERRRSGVSHRLRELSM